MDNAVETELAKTAQELAKDLREIESRVSEQLEKAKDTVEKVAEGISALRDGLSPSRIVQRHPLACVGGAALLGFLWVSRSSQSGSPAAPNQRGWLTEFGPEIRNLRNALIRQAAHFAIDKAVEATRRKAEPEPPQT